jgi:arsenite methyltransferase
MPDKIEIQVSEYYGKTLKTNADLKTSACCTPANMPSHIKSALAKIHDEVITKYYGCGLTIPHELRGRAVLDLGSGSGRDCYLLSHLVGKSGRVVGVDMTEEQLAVANKHIAYHTETFGYDAPNVTFKHGNIERLGEVGLNDGEFDIIVSNCVINLAKDKQSVLHEAHRVLKEGGELYFSDVYADRRISQELQEDPLLRGECLSGALYWNDFLRLAKLAGFADPRVVESRPMEIENEEVRKKIGHVNFYSVTYRLFKMDSLESDCEDYGQAVVYKGTAENCPQYFDLDDHHRFEVGKFHEVCGNTLLMLQKSRFNIHFDFHGSFDKHYGIFKGCGQNMPFTPGNQEESNADCC